MCGTDCLRATSFNCGIAAAYITRSPTAIIFLLYYKNDIYNRIEMDAKTLEKGQAELSTYFDKSASTVGQAFHGYVPLLSSANVSG